MNGYSGKILWVDLTHGTCVDEFVADEVYYNYLSGIGLATRVLYRRIPAGTDPLGRDNVLGFVPGLLTGTGSLFTGRWMVAAKSPLTGTWGDANCGGNLAPAIKQCGYDGIFVTGRSEEPVYLFVDNRGGRLLSAVDLWGKDALETEELLQQQYEGKKKPAVACIGQAGEKLSLISGIVNDGGRIAARSGLGAVMGSKKLKALVLAGSRALGAHNPQEMKKLSKICARRAKPLPMPPGSSLKYLGKMLAKLPAAPLLFGTIMTSMFGKWGTSSLNQFSVEWGDAPIKNWQGSNKDYPPAVSKTIAPDRFLEKEREKYHCYSCPLGCGGICSFSGGEQHKPEYETIMAFSGLLLNNDLDTIFYINDLLNRAGMDTISAGGTVAFAQECFEKGLLTLENTGGLDLSWGNTTGIVALVEKMVKREGIGDLLADGSQKAAMALGKNTKPYSITAGGQELAMHDPRNDPGYGLHASVDPTPGRHSIGCQQYYEFYALWKKVKHAPRPKSIIPVKSRFKADEYQAKSAVANSCFSQFYNGAGLCLFGALLGVKRLPIFEWLNAATGWNREPAEYMEVGRRIQTLKQLFNIKQGIDPREMKANPRTYGDPPLKKGANKGRSFDLEKMMSNYWREMGWDPETGIPTPYTIDQLGLKELVAGRASHCFATTGKAASPPKRTPLRDHLPIVNKKACVSCGSCVVDCPVTCLEMVRDVGKNPHPYPQLPEPSACIACGFCEASCPVSAIAMIPK